MLFLINAHDTKQMMLQLWKSCQFSNAMIAIRQLPAWNNLIIIHLELLCDTGADYFVVSEPNYLHDLIPRSDTVDVTVGSNDAIEFKEKLHACLHCEESYDNKNKRCFLHKIKS